MIVDENTNCTFVVDVEGHKYLLPRDVTQSIPDVPTITVSGLIVTISGIDIFNEVTVSGLQVENYVTVSGLVVENFVTVSGINVESPDVYVTVSGGASQNFEYEEIYIQGQNTSNFPNTSAYHPLPNCTYLVQPNELLHLESLTAAQSKRGLSSLALYRDGVREREIPFIEDLHIEFPMPLKYYSGEEFSLRFKPYDKKTRIQIFIDGYITEE